MLLFILVLDAIVFFMLFEVASSAMRRHAGVEDLFRDYKADNVEGAIKRNFLPLVILIGIVPSVVMLFLFKGTTVFNFFILICLYFYDDYRNTVDRPELNKYYRYMVIIWVVITVFSFVMDLRYLMKLI